MWERNVHKRITFYTDMMLYEVNLSAHGRTNVALLIEPPCISTTHYQKVIELADKFDYILTYDRNLLRAGQMYYGDQKFLFYPFGLTYIARNDWSVYPKSEFCSMTYSEKTITEGHKLRHAIAAHPSTSRMIDLFGTGAGRKIDYKLESLKPYMFSVVVENCRYATWFTEKLIDCFATGTVPIYYGAPDIKNFFNEEGILYFDTVQSLDYKLQGMRNHADSIYRSMQDAIMDNYIRAMQYTIPEDWIFKNYPFIFKGEENVG